MAASVHWAAHLIAAAPVLTSTAFALGQLLLGAGLLWARTARWSLAASIGRALAVWWLGEGLGGLASGHALLQALPGNGAVQALASSADDAPGPLASLDRTLASALGAHSTAVTITAAVVTAAVGLTALAPRPWRTAAAWSGIALALLFWVIGQGAGQLTSGQSTDPDAGPLLVLLATAVLSTQGTPRIRESIPEPRNPAPGQPASMPVRRRHPSVARPAPVTSATNHPLGEAAL
ncbi:hypothetical protein ACFO3J_32195 [Streptomyces polygonati]|uniref:Integral membrane protein n=1 Tax=Streptomyces polygonati TaxID=1617087 RepID=A0ABV8HVM4_9ACTN